MPKISKGNHAVMERFTRKNKHGEEIDSTQLHGRRGERDMFGTDTGMSRKIKKLTGGRLSKPT